MRLVRGVGFQALCVRSGWNVPPMQDSVAFEETEWRRGVRRIHWNLQRSMVGNTLNRLTPLESKVGGRDIVEVRPELLRDRESKKPVPNRPSGHRRGTRQSVYIRENCKASPKARGGHSLLLLVPQKQAGIQSMWVLRRRS